MTVSIWRVDLESGDGPSRLVRILVVDDHPLFRAGLRAALESDPGLRVVGEAETAQAALDAVAQARPDVIIMDLTLPDASGLDATRRLGELYPDVPVLMLTMANDDGSLLAALQAGAHGYLVKGSGREEVLHAVRTVASGGAAFGADIASRFSTLVTGGRQRDVGRLFPDLTARECEVLGLVARGFDNRRIARELFVAEKTVRNHVTHIFEKLNVATRAEAVARARDMGLGDA
jgi:DNA-binding NarL/FixJ family response regulator